MALERKALWEPAWKGPIEGWTVNFTAKNLWRVAPLYEFEDLIQDAYTVFLRCVRAYPEVFEPAHFMSLYQRSVMRHVIDLSNCRSAERQVRPPKGELREELRERIAQPSKDLQEVDLNLLLEDAPKALQDFAEAFYALPRAAVAYWRDLDTGWRETHSIRVRRLFGRKGWRQTRKWLMDLEIPMLENTNFV